MTLSLRIEAADPTPPYEQLRRQLASLIAAGELEVDSRLPPVRQLAGDLGVAVGTVARAYRELEQHGLVRSRHGGGTTVASPARTITPADRGRRVNRSLLDAVRAARLLGATDHEITDALQQAFRVADADSH